MFFFNSNFSKTEEQKLNQKEGETHPIGIQKPKRTHELDVETGNQSSR